MTSTTSLLFKGAPGSPYTRKMLAYLRYRHIPYRFFVDGQEERPGLPRPRVALLPTFYLPNAQGEMEAVVDSTPLIRRFESEFEGRATVPTDPALSFINYLIEDYADEWLTKPMFHYRWHYADDIDQAGTVLPLWRQVQASKEQMRQLKDYVAGRQISRLYVVGSNDTTAPVIEAGYQRFLQVMDALIQRQPFVLGARPSSADLAIYAQLTQLTHFDPTPSALCLQQAPRLYAWVDLVDDLSGHAGDEVGWLSMTALKDALTDLLAEIGRVYVPVLLANAEALAAGEKEMRAEVDGQPWVQPSFPYQGKCLWWLNEQYRALDETAKGQVDDLLAGTGCKTLFTA